MEYVLTEKQVENVVEELREINMHNFRPLAINKKENIDVIRLNDTVYICEDIDFSKCIACGNLEWWESVKDGYLAKGFTEDLVDDEDD